MFTEKLNSNSNGQKIHLGCFFSISSLSRTCLSNLQFHFTLHFIDMDDMKSMGNLEVPYDVVLIDKKRLGWIDTYNKKELWNDLHLPLLLMLQEKDTVSVKMLMHPLVDRTVINCENEINFSEKIKKAFALIKKENEKEQTHNVLYQNSENKHKKDFLTKLNHIIEVNMESGEITLPDIASQFRMSTLSIRNKIKEMTGRTAVRYILEYRLMLAKNLLTEQQYNVQETALKTGFLSSSYFTKSFKTMFGMVPSRCPVSSF